jgi:hypothetical protein
MKKILFLAFLAIGITACAQFKTVKLSAITAGPVWGGYCEKTNLDNNKSTQYVYLNFYANHNGENPVVSVYLNTQTELDAFIKDMESALTEIDSRTSISWTRKAYSINTSATSGIIYLFQKPAEGSAYTILKKGQVVKLLSILKAIHIK